MSRGKHRIIASHALHQLVGEGWPVDEKTVKAAMNPLWELDHYNVFDSMAWAIAMAKTASVYVVGRDARDLAFNGKAVPSAEGTHLPPMPFKRMILEVHDQDGPLPWGVGSTLVYTGTPQSDGYVKTSDGEPLRVAVRVVALLVTEVERGEAWDVAAVVGRERGVFFARDRQIEIDGFDTYFANTVHVWTYRVTPGGVTAPRLADGDDLGRYWMAWVSHHVVQAMHLVTAKGIWHTDAGIDRKQRRRFERETGAPMPPVYWVDISGPMSEEPDTPVAGGGTRDWSHRWMVQGHWRYYKGGKRESGRTFKAQRVWIDSYIKGPDRDKRGRPTTLRRPIHTTVKGLSTTEIEV